MEISELVKKITSTDFQYTDDDAHYNYYKDVYLKGKMKGGITVTLENRYALSKGYAPTSNVVDEEVERFKEWFARDALSLEGVKFE